MKLDFLKNKTVLLKRKPKKQFEIKVVNQQKMNKLFVGGLVAFVCLCLLTIIVSFTRQISPAKTTTTTAATTVENIEEVDYRLHLFLDGYVVAYFNNPSDWEGQEKRTEELNGYYNFVPTIKSQGLAIDTIRLVTYQLLWIKDSEATYRVTYSIEKETNQEQTVIFSIPYGKDKKTETFFVSGLPWFQKATDFKATEVNPKDELTLAAVDKMTKKQRKLLNEFIDLFFVNYTTNQKNLDIIAKEIQGFDGADYKSLDYAYYKQDNESIKAYVQVTFEINGISYSENFTLTLEDKNETYYVTKLEHAIPANYAD